MERSRWPAVKLAATYMVFAAAWIVASDLLIALLPTVAADSLQTVKGLLFVGVSGLVLYALVQRMHDDIMRGRLQARSAEVLLQQVIDTVPVGVLFVNDDGVITFMNPSAEALLSLPSADGVGMRLEELCGVDGPGTSARVGELLRTGAVDGIMLSRPGVVSGRAFAARARSVDPAAAVSGWVVALTDFTETHLATERTERLMSGYRFLAQSLVLAGRAGDPQALLRQVAALAIERGGYRAAWVILRSDAESGFTDVALERLGGEAAVTSEALRAQALAPHSAVAESLLGSGISVSNDIERDPAHPWYALATQERLGSSASFGVSGLGELKAGITLFAETPGYFDAEELDVLRQLQAALSFAFDKIGLDRERLAAEEELEWSERGYRQLFMANPMPLWIYDTATLEFLAVNDAAVQKYGWSPEEFSSMTIADIRPASDVPALRDSVAQGGDGFEDAGVWTHRDKSGREFPVHIYAHPLEWDGHDAEMVLTQEVATIT